MKLTTALVAVILAACAAHALPIAHEQAPTVFPPRDTSELVDGTIAQRDLKNVFGSLVLPKSKSLSTDVADLTDLGLLNAGARSDSKEFLDGGLKRSTSIPWRSLLKKSSFLMRKKKPEVSPYQSKVVSTYNFPYKQEKEAQYVITEKNGKQKLVVHSFYDGKVKDPALEDTDGKQYKAYKLNANALPMIAAH